MSYGYIDTTIELDSLDILNLISLVEARIEEIKSLIKPGQAGMVKMIAEEQLFTYNDTLAKLKAASEEVKRVALAQRQSARR